MRALETAADAVTTPPRPGEQAEEEELTLTGALLVRVLGVADDPERLERSRLPATTGVERRGWRATALDGGRRRGRSTRKAVDGAAAADGALAPVALCASIAVAAGGVMLEALLLRSLLDVGLRLELSAQRMGAVAAIATLGLALLLIELPAAQGMLRIGRRLEMALRMAFLRKLPALGDRYFSSRLSSDMAERSHAIHQIRNVAPLAGQLVRTTFELLLVTAGLIWLDPRSAPWALLAAAGSLAVPLLSFRALVERDLRLRSHAGGLSRFYLDGLLGLIPIRAHSAEEVVRREHETLVTEWSRASLRLQRLVAGLQGCSAPARVRAGGRAGALASRSRGVGRDRAAPGLLGTEPARARAGARAGLVALPWYRNVTLRLLEPLGASEHRCERSARARRGRRPRRLTLPRAASWPSGALPRRARRSRCAEWAFKPAVTSSCAT